MTEQKYTMTKEHEMVKKLSKFVEWLDADIYEALDYDDNDFDKAKHDIELIETLLERLKKELA